VDHLRGFNCARKPCSEFAIRGVVAFIEVVVTLPMKPSEKIFVRRLCVRYSFVARQALRRSLL